jgi:hypothetical protein
MRRAVAVVAAGALLLALTACGPYAARSFPLGAGSDTVPGIWITEDGATLEFDDDGAFGFSELPAAITSGSDGDGSFCADELAASTDRLSGDGRWSYEGDQVRLQFESRNAALFPFGFASFSGLEYLCDIDGPSYRFDRQ